MAKVIAEHAKSASRDGRESLPAAGPNSDHVIPWRWRPI